MTTVEEKMAALARIAPLLLLTSFLAFAAHQWLEERDARLKAETQSGQQQRQIDGLKQREAEAQALLSQKLADLANERKAPATAAQLVSNTDRLVPGLPEALRINSVAADPDVPQGPAVQTIVVPQADFKSLRDAQLTCQEDAAKLTSCEANGKEQLQQLKLTEAQRDEWKATAKGGSVWHRTLSAAKWFAIGAGSGVVAYAVVHHK